MSVTETLGLKNLGAGEKLAVGLGYLGVQAQVAKQLAKMPLIPSILTQHKQALEGLDIATGLVQALPAFIGGDPRADGTLTFGLQMFGVGWLARQLGVDFKGLDGALMKYGLALSGGSYASRVVVFMGSIPEVHNSSWGSGLGSRAVNPYG